MQSMRTGTLHYPPSYLLSRYVGTLWQVSTSSLACSSAATQLHYGRSDISLSRHEYLHRQVVYTNMFPIVSGYVTVALMEIWHLLFSPILPSSICLRVVLTLFKLDRARLTWGGTDLSYPLLFLTLQGQVQACITNFNNLPT
ncbi:hypothetical protein LZ32DRAFT_237265 [Colletotrichum eremochloae]|nr:hypothetical protein LZ32DRAFT_237265 [Colletotrichum eremochloae]